MYMCVSVYGYVYMNGGAHGGLKRELDPLELEL